MRHACLLVLLACLAIAGCATTHEPGWQGNNAEPFDAAHQTCEAEAATAAEGERESHLETCMAARGWTRPQP